MQSYRQQAFFKMFTNLLIIAEKTRGGSNSIRAARFIGTLSAITIVTLLFVLRLHASALPLQHQSLDTCSAIDFAQLFTGSITAGESDCFTFTGTGNDRVRVRVVTSSGVWTPYFEIFNAANNQSVCSTIVGESDCVLQSSGEHQIVVRDFTNNHSGSYALSLQRLNDPVGCTSLSFGALPITGTVAAAAELDCFTLDGVSGDRIRTRVVETAGSNFTAHFEIMRPDGTSLCSTVVGEKDCHIDQTGPQTILVKDFDGTKTGDYSLYLQRLNSPVGCASLGLSGDQDTIDVAAQVNCYTFQATGNGEVDLNVHEDSGQLSAYSEIVRPDGTTACETILDDLTCGLNGAGVHTILVDDFAGIYTGTYQITLQCPAGNCTFAATPTPTPGPTQTPVPPTATPSPTANANKVFVPLVSR